MKQTLSPGTGAPASARTFWILAGLIVLGLLVRVPRLTESLWYDEIAAWMDYGRHGPGWIVTQYYDPANHIGHTLASWAGYSLLADHVGEAMALRLPALLFSLASIIAVWGMVNCAMRRHSDSVPPAGPGEPGAPGRDAPPAAKITADEQKKGVRLLFRPKKVPDPFFGGRVGVIAGLLMAVGPVSVLEGAEARGYSMMICFAALATWSLLSALNDERWTKWLLYAAVCSLGIWSHMMMVWVPIGHAVWLTWRMPRGENRGFALRGLTAIALAAALTTLLYWPVLGNILRIRSEFTSAEGDEPSVFGIEGLHTLLLVGGAWYWWAALPGLVAAAIGLVSLRRIAKPQAAERGAICAALLGLPTMVIVLWAAGSWMYARFALFVLPGAVLLMAMGIDRLWRWKPSIGAAGLAIIVICAGLDLGLRPSRQPLREAAAFVRAKSIDDDGLLIVGLRHQVMDVYASDLNPQYSLLHGQDLEAQLDAIRPRWVIVMYPRNVAGSGYEAMTRRGYSMNRRFDGWIDWGNGAIEVWQ